MIFHSRKLYCIVLNLWFVILNLTLQSGGGFTLVDFTIPTREVPISHPGAQAPLCDEVTPFCTHVALY